MPKTREILWSLSDKVLRPKLQNRTKNYDFIIDNSWHSYYPIAKNRNTAYMKLTHTAFHKNGFSVDEKYYERIKNFDFLIILSKNELSIWQKYHKNVFVIPNFLPQIPQKSTDSAQKVVLSAGRFSSEKGFLRLIDIWHIVAQDKGFADKKWRLIIVGDGPLKSEIQSKIKSLNLQDSIILKPFTKEIEREYLGASIYAMASHFEGFPMVLVEASSYALPCIAFDIATGPSDIIAHNKSGYLVSDNDLDTYAKHLITLMSDESKRIAFGGEAKRLVGERFSKEVVMEKWEKLLRKIAESSEKIH
ncbi:glycosyltransferase [Helicobacter sp. 23-1045]